MKKSTLFFCTAATLLAIGFANAKLIPTNDFVEKKTKREIPAGFTLMNPNGQKTEGADNTKKELDQTQTSLVLFEDFNNVPDGEFVQTGNIGMRAVTSIANHDCGNFMNPEYTPNSGQWFGSWVFAGTGGSIILQCYNPMVAANIQLPLGDYSGDLILTVRLRAAKTFWGADNEVGYETAVAVATNTQYRLTVGGFGSDNNANSEVGYGQLLANVYGKDGWVEAKVRFRNESSNSDGTIVIGCQHACEIDWIKVEDAGTYLAAPVSGGITDFQENEFSIKWGDVRRSFNYYIDFFYAKWLAESNINEMYDFENGIPADFTAGGASAAETEGMNSTKGIHIGTGVDNAFLTPTYYSRLENVSLNYICKWGKDMGEITENSQCPTLCIDGLTAEGWIPVTEIPIDNWLYAADVYKTGRLSGEQFADKYTALRFHSRNTDAETYFVIDNVSVYAPRPYELERVIDNDPEHEHYQENLETYQDYIDNGLMTEEEALEALNSPFNTWWTTKYGDPCEYTFNHCVEPDKEYFYRIRSHRLEYDERGNTFVPSEMYHALGVAIPKNQDVENINSDSYTLTWKDAAKAQTFVAHNYKATEITEDTPNYTVFDETFSRLEGPSTFEAYEPVSGDVDTDMPGWTGEDVTMGENGLGCGMGGILTSPEIGIVTHSPYTVHIEAEGIPGETLVVQFNGLRTYAMAAFGESGRISGTMEVDWPVEGESLSFYTYNGYPFAMKSVDVIQDVKRGDVVRVFDSSLFVPAGIQKATFTGLDPESKYAGKVVSHFNFEKKSVSSAPNNAYQIVDLKNGTSSDYSKVNEIEEDATVVARYTIEGLNAPENYKGIVIERLSNGKTRKVMVK